MKLVSPVPESDLDQPSLRWRNLLLEKQLKKLTGLEGSQLRQWQKSLDKLMPALNGLELLWDGSGEPEGVFTPHGQALDGINLNNLYCNEAEDGRDLPMTCYLIRMGFMKSSVRKIKEEMRPEEEIDLFSELFQHSEADLKLYIAYFWLLAEKKGDLFAHRALESLIEGLVRPASEERAVDDEVIDNERQSVAEEALVQVMREGDEKAVGDADPVIAERIRSGIADRMISFTEGLIDANEARDRVVRYFSNSENRRKIVTKIIAAKPKV